jgi:hypothetical protein
MKKLSIGILALACGVGFGTGATAQGMSKDQYKSAKDGIASAYKTDKASCKSLSGNAKDVCMEEAKGKQTVAKAELEAQYKPSDRNQYKARVAKADADYSVAKEKCDDQKGADKKACVKEAKAAHTAAVAEAKASMKSARATATAPPKTGEDRMKGPNAAAEARKDAAAIKRQADYAAAQAKCDTMSGDAKDKCMKAAKAKYTPDI